jgi:SAM-dependent methyltransferase
VALERHRRDWEDLAKLDAFRAVLVAPQSEEEFFRSGAEEVAAMLAEAERLRRPARRERALDFGCGLGRLTRALAGSFGECVGVDISATMVERARELNADRRGCTFVVNTEPHLGRFTAASFDLVYSSIVLQHMPSRAVAASYIGELVRVTRPDGLTVFQFPLRLPWRNRVQPRRRLYALLRAVGVDRGRLHGGGLTPMRMLGLAEDEVRRIVGQAGGHVLATTPSAAAGRYASLVYYVARA